MKQIDGELSLVCRAVPRRGTLKLQHPVLALGIKSRRFHLVSLKLEAGIEDDMLEYSDDDDGPPDPAWQDADNLSKWSEEAVAEAICSQVTELESLFHLGPKHIIRLLEHMPKLKRLKVAFEGGFRYNASGDIIVGRARGEPDTFDADAVVENALRDTGRLPLEHLELFTRDCGLPALRPYGELVNMATRSIALPLAFDLAIKDPVYRFFDASQLYRSAPGTASSPFVLGILVSEDHMDIRPKDVAYYLMRNCPSTTEIRLAPFLDSVSEEMKRWMRNVLGARALLLRTLLGGPLPGFRQVTSAGKKRDCDSE